MHQQNKRGKYSRDRITTVSADLTSEKALDYKKEIAISPEEGVYIYSFVQGKMIYAEGWDEVVGLKNDQISMMDIVNLTAGDFSPFVEEVNDKALSFLNERNQNLIDYSFRIYIKMMHKDGSQVPVTATVSVHSCQENGQLDCIMGRFQVNRSLRFGDVMKISAYGPEKGDFVSALDPVLFKTLMISEKEREAVKYVAEGLAFKQIADKLNVSQSAIEKRIYGLFKRFEVNSLAHLVNYAHNNFLLD